MILTQNTLYRSSAWLFWPQWESTATTGVQNQSPRTCWRATLTLWSPSANSSTRVRSRYTATGSRRDRLRTEQHFSRTAPRPSWCPSWPRLTSPSTTFGNRDTELCGNVLQLNCTELKTEMLKHNLLQVPLPYEQQALHLQWLYLSRGQEVWRP